jgi:hypothetical protein
VPMNILASSPRAWFKEAIERWNVAESIYHFGTIYPPERLDEYGREKLEQGNWHDCIAKSDNLP